jgi:hypothetical protein
LKNKSNEPLAVKLAVAPDLESPLVQTSGMAAAEGLVAPDLDLFFLFQCISGGGYVLEPSAMATTAATTDIFYLFFKVAVAGRNAVVVILVKDDDDGSCFIYLLNEQPWPTTIAAVFFFKKRFQYTKCQKCVTFQPKCITYYKLRITLSKWVHNNLMVFRSGNNIQNQKMCYILAKMYYI